MGRPRKYHLLLGETESERISRIRKAHYENKKMPGYKPRKQRPNLSPLTKEFILDNVTQDPVTKCWNWNLNKSKGYGRARHLGKVVQVHCAAYTLWTGNQISEGLFGCHKCDNRACCNPDHIFIGTQSQNLQDASSKGRMVIPNKKLIDKQAEIIRSDPRMQKVIAAEYGVSQQCVSRIQLGQLYLGRP